MPTYRIETNQGTFEIEANRAPTADEVRQMVTSGQLSRTERPPQPTTEPLSQAPSPLGAVAGALRGEQRLPFQQPEAPAPERPPGTPRDPLLDPLVPPFMRTPGMQQARQFVGEQTLPVAASLAVPGAGVLADVALSAGTEATQQALGQREPSLRDIGIAAAAPPVVRGIGRGLRAGGRGAQRLLERTPFGRLARQRAQEQADAALIQPLQDAIEGLDIDATRVREVRQRFLQHRADLAERLDAEALAQRQQNVQRARQAIGDLDDSTPEQLRELYAQVEQFNLTVPRDRLTAVQRELAREEQLLRDIPELQNPQLQRLGRSPRDVPQPPVETGVLDPTGRMITREAAPPPPLRFQGVQAALSRIGQLQRGLRQSNAEDAPVRLRGLARVRDALERSLDDMAQASPQGSEARRALIAANAAYRRSKVAEEAGELLERFVRETPEGAIELNPTGFLNALDSAAYRQLRENLATMGQLSGVQQTMRSLAQRGRTVRQAARGMPGAMAAAETPAVRPGRLRQSLRQIEQARAAARGEPVRPPTAGARVTRALLTTAAGGAAGGGPGAAVGAGIGLGIEGMTRALLSDTGQRLLLSAMDANAPVLQPAAVRILNLATTRAGQALPPGEAPTGPSPAPSILGGVGLRDIQ